jgi:hypothetical protein
MSQNPTVTGFGLSRDAALAYVAIRSNSVAIWRHQADLGWSRTPLSPDALEAMADTEVLAWVSRLRPSDEEIRGWVRTVFPAMPDSEIREMTRENGDSRLVVLCDACGAEISDSGPAYLVWDAKRLRWLTYCSSHRPSEYWREWPSGRPALK